MEELQVQEQTCIHWWLIELSNGHTSPGTCKFCLETRDFVNSIDNVFDARVGTPRPHEPGVLSTSDLPW